MINALPHQPGKRDENRQVIYSTNSTLAIRTVNTIAASKSTMTLEGILFINSMASARDTIRSLEIAQLPVRRSGNFWYKHKLYIGKLQMRVDGQFPH